MTEALINPMRPELETAKEILAEIFGAQLSNMEEMIQRRHKIDIDNNCYSGFTIVTEGSNGIRIKRI